MGTETSSIDELLSGSGAHATQAPEEYSDSSDVSENSNKNEYGESGETTITHSAQENNENAPEDFVADDYGNLKEKPRVYTEEEVNDRINKAIRERLSRMKTQDQPMPTVGQVQQAQGFNYNPNSEQGWEQQLESFVEQTFTKINQRQATQAQQQRDIEAHNAFEEKFANGMERFNDFRDVVGAQPITDPMTLALRGVNDPAAFVYAASKRHPAELQRISQLRDPYAQMVEMGKLEERMRKSTVSTTAPRPIGRSREDTGMPVAKNKNEGESIESLIEKAEAKKRAQINARYKK